MNLIYADFEASNRLGNRLSFKKYELSVPAFGRRDKLRVKNYLKPSCRERSEWIGGAPSPVIRDE